VRRSAVGVRRAKLLLTTNPDRLETVVIAFGIIAASLLLYGFATLNWSFGFLQ
jgi:hypothetical protein